MDQQVCTEQKPRHITAPLHEGHPVIHRERAGEALKTARIILTDHHQPCTLAQLCGQARYSTNRAINPFGDKAGANLHQQQVIVSQSELGTKLGTHLGRIGRCPAIRRNTRRQQMKAVQRGFVMLGEQRLLHLRDHQNLRIHGRGEHGLLISGKMTITAGEAVERITQGLRLVFKTGVGGVVDVQPRHLIEPDHPIDRALGQIGFDPGGKFFIAAMIAQRLDRRHQHLKPLGNIAFPDQRVDTNRVTAGLAHLGDTHEIALQPAKGKILVEHKRQLHQTTLLLGSNDCNCCMTRSGFRRVKHSGCSRVRSNRRASSGVGW